MPWLLPPSQTRGQSRAVVRKLLDNGLVERAASQGIKLREALVQKFGQHAHVGDIRGRGLFQGLELVQDRETKQPFDPARGVAGRVKAAAFEAGLICYPMSGTRDGKHGDHVLLAPPFIISDAQIDELTGKLSTAIEVALS